tara:strand:- start:223 stop:561 length:339 start_codon:yes stop_codon:yes gene_type:complete
LSGGIGTQLEQNFILFFLEDYWVRMILEINIMKIKKKTKRWVIYKGEIDASKISADWYSWIHFMKNKIEFNTKIKKYDWQKPHLSNQTGTKNAYHPNKKDVEIKKKYKIWKS